MPKMSISPPWTGTSFFVHTIWESFLHLNLAGTTYQGRWDNWYGPSGRSSTYSYDYQKVLKSPAGLSLKAINVPLPNKAKMNSLRKSVDVQCKRPKHASACQPLQQLCLFNILSDPCELNNVRIIFSYFSFSVLFLRNRNFFLSPKMITKCSRNEALTLLFW